MTRTERWLDGLVLTWAGSSYLLRSRGGFALAIITVVSAIGMGVAAVLAFRERLRAREAARTHPAQQRTRRGGGIPAR